MFMTGTGMAARRAYGGRSAEDRRAERRERLMSAGLELFGNEGYAAASIERLCAQAGVSTRNFYEEFASREDLLMRLHDRRWARLSFVEVIGVSDAVEEHRIAWRERWADFLVAEAQRAVDRGEARQREFRLGAVGLIGAVNELVHHYSIGAGHDGSLDDVIGEIVRLALGVLA
jgi:AcrR family transcriptional regulator